MAEEIQSFSGFKLNKQLLSAVAEAGFTTPTPIQQRAIPAVLAGHDVLGIAQTGTGKTAAYLLPLLMKIKYAQGQDPRALILVPTRELSMQVTEQIRVLAKYTDLRYMALYGGVGMKLQRTELSKGIDILVATPGRLMEMYLEGAVGFKKVEHFVMDEAERLLELGFKRQIDRILEVVPRKRQNLLFTATWNEKVRSISDDFLKSPFEIQISPETKTAKNIRQSVYFIPNLKSKINLLDHLLNDEIVSKVIIFCKSKKVATDIGKYLLRKYGEENVRVIHSNKDQNTRIHAIQAFREGGIRFLVATDVAARGIDVESVSHVINFDVPVIYQEYIHRIGRTGRASLSGDSITFCSPAEVYHLKKIQKLIGQKIPVIEIPGDIELTETPYEENQLMLREIDQQRRKEDPEYRGAFHEKKKRN